MNDVNNSLARAASEGLTECVKCLLEAGADPNRPDEVTLSLDELIGFLVLVLIVSGKYGGTSLYVMGTEGESEV